MSMKRLGIVCREAAKIEWQCVGCSGKLETSMTSHTRPQNWSKAGIHTKVIQHSYMSGIGMLSTRD